MRCRLPLLIAFALAVCGSAHAQNPPASETATEFPPYDTQILAVQQRGLAAAAASAALAREPNTVGTLKLLLDQERIDESIGVAERILAEHPDQAFGVIKAIASASYRFSDQARGYPEARQRLADRARLVLPTLRREEAARLARQIIVIDGRKPSAPPADPGDALAEFVKEYAGTDEALLTEVDVIVQSRISWQQIETLDAFARAHAGTVAGAKALFEEGFQLGVNIPLSDVEPRGSDPTARFQRVLAIAKELESGSYPPCEWVDRVPELATGFFTSNPVFAPGKADRMAAEYIAFARDHLVLRGAEPFQSGVGYLLTWKMAELYKADGDPLPHVEQALDRLAAETGRADVAYLKANFYLRMGLENPRNRTVMRTKAKAALTTLADGGSDLFQRKALATLACVEFEDADYSSAIEHFTHYLQRYPRSPYAWVAALRIGASQEALGEWAAAAASYRSAAAKFHAIPIADVLGHEYAARSLEGVGGFQDALSEHESARRAFDAGYGREYVLPSRHAPAEDPTLTFEPIRPVTRDALDRTIAQLRASLADPAGPLLERGRWLLEHERRPDATESLAELLRRFPRSPLAGQARLLSNHARLESALALASVESAGRDPAGALAQLTTLAAEPYDEAVCVAGVARATLLAQERADEAHAAMQKTLDACRLHGAAPRTAPRSALEADVLAIRNAVFLPFGGGVYGSRGWNAFSWPSAAPSFLLVNPAIVVTSADGSETPFVLRDAFPGLDNVVFFDSAQIHLLTSVMTALGGTKRSVPASVMATPNQPAGAAVDVRAFWNQFFPCRQGHWFGWEFEAYPRIGSIRFLDAARTRATVPVTIGYSGATVVLEKRDGVWRALRLANEWIT